MTNPKQMVWLARHGNRQDFVDPDWPKTAERPYDPGLSPDGLEQAHRLAQRLRGEGIRRVFASPFLRTVQTANKVAEVLDLPIHLEPGLGEWLNPVWFAYDPAPLAPERMARQFPRIDTRYAPLNGSVYPEVEEAVALARAGETARRLVAAYPEPILLVGHGVSVAGAVWGLVPEATITACALCSLFQVVREPDGWHLALCGDIAHLAAEAARES